MTWHATLQKNAAAFAKQKGPLGYAGKKDDAQKQFALAATLDLTAAEKSQLAHHL